MNRILLILAIAGIVTACEVPGKDPDKISMTDENGNEVSIDKEFVNNRVAIMNELQEKADKLKTLIPITLDEAKALLPTTLGGITITDEDLDSGNGIVKASAEYKSGTREIELEIYDCTGEEGRKVFLSQLKTMANFATENENSYIKTIDLNGKKAIEEMDKIENEIKLRYFEKNRFLVMLEAKGITAEELRKIAGQIKI